MSILSRVLRQKFENRQVEFSIMLRSFFGISITKARTFNSGKCPVIGPLIRRNTRAFILII